jgi:hypothetical protein
VGGLRHRNSDRARAGDGLPISAGRLAHGGRLPDRRATDAPSEGPRAPTAGPQGLSRSILGRRNIEAANVAVRQRHHPRCRSKHVVRLYQRTLRRKGHAVAVLSRRGSIISQSLVRLDNSPFIDVSRSVTAQADQDVPPPTRLPGPGTEG